MTIRNIVWLLTSLVYALSILSLVLIKENYCMTMLEYVLSIIICAIMYFILLNTLFNILDKKDKKEVKKDE